MRNVPFTVLQPLKANPDLAARWGLVFLRGKGTQPKWEEDSQIGGFNGCFVLDRSG